MKAEDAAKRLGISPRTLADWTTQGFIPSIKRGGVRLYSVDALREWARTASVYEEASRGKATMGSRVDLQAPWGRTVGSGRAGSPRPIRGHGTGSQDAAG